MPRARRGPRERSAVTTMRRLIVLGLTLGVLLVLARYADPSAVAVAVASMPRTSQLLLAGLLLASALTRAARWSYYLRSAALPIRRRDAISSYLAALSISWLPGGSLLAPRLAQEHGQVYMREAAPALVIRVIADLLVVASLTFAMMLGTHQPRDRLLIPVAGLALAGLLITMSRSARVWAFIDRLLGRFRLTRRWRSKEIDIQVRVQALMRRRVLATGMLWSLATTALSVLILWVLVNALTVRGITFPEATRIHVTVATVGVLAPIGIGVSIGDSSQAQLLNTLGMAWTRVVFVLVTLRSVTLLFQAIIGVTTLLLCYRPWLAAALAMPRRSRATRRWIGGAWSRRHRDRDGA